MIIGSDNTIEHQDLNKVYDKILWDDSVKSLGLEIAEKFEKPICLISRKEILEGDSKSEEHVILQGLGTKWIKLPPGFIHDKRNNQMCSAEGNFLNNGLMGVLRPFFLRKHKSADFEYPDGRKVKFKNDPHHGFEIHLEGFEVPTFHENQSGNIVFPHFPIKKVHPLSVSRAIHKIAYLAFCVHLPKCVFQINFDEVLQLIEKGKIENYRPYTEEFVSGACPGFDIWFFMTFIELDSQNLEVKEIFVKLRLHHMKYTFNLLGHHEYLPNKKSTYCQYYPQPDTYN